MTFTYPFHSPLKTILLSGFVAGTIDIVSAIVLLAGGNAEGTLRYVASGAFGNAAFLGGNSMIFYGLLFHFIIAFSFAIGYFVVYPFIPFLGKHRIISALLYGIFVWCFMRFVVLPFTYIQLAPFSFSPAVFKNAGILMYAIGLPVSFITSAYYSSKKARE